MLVELTSTPSQVCERWTAKHIKQLSPKLHAHCEALITLFQGQLQNVLQTEISVAQLAFLIRRDGRMSPSFALCLHHYMVKMDQDKGVRNANYKSMNNATTANSYAMRALHQFFLDHSAYILSCIAETNDEVGKFLFSPRTIDWMLIVNQLKMQEPKTKRKKAAPLNSDSD